MTVYAHQNLGDSLSAIVSFDDSQDEAIRSFERGNTEPVIKPVGLLWWCTNATILSNAGTPAGLTEAWLRWGGAAWAFYAPITPLLAASGAVPLTGTLNANGQKISSLLAGAAAGDAIRKDQALLRDGSQAMTAPLPMGSQKITSLAAGEADTDAVNVSQVASLLDGTVQQLAHFRTLGQETRIDSGWTPGTTTFVQKINETAFVPEGCRLLIKAQLQDADDFQVQNPDFSLVLDLARWRHATAADDNGGVFPVIAGHWLSGGVWTPLGGSFDQAEQGGASPAAWDFESDLMGTVRLYVRFWVGAPPNRGVEFWFRRDALGAFQDLDEVGGGAEGIVQLFVYGK